MDPFVAEIRMFDGRFALSGWATCDGQLLPISQNTALFSLLGTYYGGDGKSTFALPNLSGSSPMQAGQGAGLSERFLGEVGGVENVTLLTTEIPIHTHLLEAYTDDLADLNEVSPNVILGKGSGITPYSPPANINTQMSPNAISIAGSSFPHNNMMPFLAVYFIIALQ